MEALPITQNIIYLGVNDRTIDLFESQYPVPNGVTYNSYLILDEKIAVMDAVDGRAAEEWLNNLRTALAGRKPDYFIISHLEPDHSGAIASFLAEYPEATLVGNAKTFVMANNFFEAEDCKKLTVKEGEALPLGEHALRFFMAPMVHWPEVMVTFEERTKTLFSADAFGKFGTLDCEEEWLGEARRYYINIVGKYGNPVQTLLKKAEGLPIERICPLHGPVLQGGLDCYLDCYRTWCSYQPEGKGILVAYASIHGNTAKAAETVAKTLEAAGAEVSLVDLARTHSSYAVAEAFRCEKLVLAASSYDGGVFPPMENFLCKLRDKAYQKRKVALIENGSWAPSAARKMREYLANMKVEVLDSSVTVTSTVKKETEAALESFAAAVLAM